MRRVKLPDGMRWGIIAVSFVMMPAGQAAQQGGAPISLSNNDDPQDIIVRARPQQRPPIRDVVDYYQYHCVESLRLTRQATMPVKDPDWRTIDPADFPKLGISGPDAWAYGMRDDQKGWTVFLTLQRPTRKDGLHEAQCALMILGETDKNAIIQRMSAVLWSRPTTRHVGALVGVAKAPGWDRWLWTGTPSRKSKDWANTMTNRRGPGIKNSFVVVTNMSFYGYYDYVYGELKINKAGRMPITVLSFNYVSADGKE